MHQYAVPEHRKRRLFFVIRNPLIVLLDRIKPKNRTYFSVPGAPGGRALPVAAIKTRAMSETTAIIHICRESEQRKILAIHVVFQIERAGKSGPGNLIFIP